VSSFTAIISGRTSLRRCGNDPGLYNRYSQALNVVEEGDMGGKNIGVGLRPALDGHGYFIRQCLPYERQISQPLLCDPGFLEPGVRQKQLKQSLNVIFNHCSQPSVSLCEGANPPVRLAPSLTLPRA
jgi:hypothetical protein